MIRGYPYFRKPAQHSNPARGLDCRIGLRSLFQCSKSGAVIGPRSINCRNWSVSFDWSFLIHASSHCSFAKRLQWEVFDCAVLQSRGLEGSGTEILSTWFLEACGCRPSRVGSYSVSASCGTRDGDHLTAVVLEAKLAATGRTFALFCSGSDRVVTWGLEVGGGSEVQDQLKGVQQLQATDQAFAAILADGSVVTWGDPEFGGDSSEVQDQLKGVPAASSNEPCICCDPGWWVSRDLGPSNSWRSQL